MHGVKRTSAICISVAGSLLAAAANADANPMPLADRQLDAITAGGAIVVLVNSDAAAAGALALTATTGNSIVGQDKSPYPGQPEFAPSGGAAEGTALAVGTNVGLQGEPPTYSDTGVTTAGAANGNQVITTTINQTMHGAGGVTFQAGWTFVYGAWVGL